MAAERDPGAPDPAPPDPLDRGRREIAIRRLRDQRVEETPETVVVEEPLEVRLNGVSVAVTMRTPGHDPELAVGFLVTEGVIENPEVIVSAAHCEDNENVVDVRTAPGARGVNPPAPRSFYASSSCGVCGKANIEAVQARVRDLRGDALRVSAARIAELPRTLAGAQPLFTATGAIHAAGLFDADGNLRCAREDVGRHNAVDKVVGWAAMRDALPLRGSILLVSGRCGYELAQKAVMAGIPILAAISGPSSLAIELARACGLTLVAFVRGSNMNLCSEPDRIVP